MQLPRLPAQPVPPSSQHPFNLGQGAALQTGIDYALARGAEVIVTFDADGQHRVADIAGLVDALTEERADFVLGSRFLGQATDLPPLRRLLLRAATLFTRLTTGLRLTRYAQRAACHVTPRGQPQFGCAKTEWRMHRSFSARSAAAGLGMSNGP